MREGFMTLRFFVVALGVWLVSFTAGSAQVVAVAGNGRMPTLAEQLQQHKIALTRKALTSALRNADAEIRELAALKLAEDGAKESIPVMEDAFAVESSEGAKVNIAFALAQLGDENGIVALTNACRDSALGTGSRLQAVRYTLDLNNNSCMTVVVAILRSHSEDDATYRMEALSLIPSFKHVSREDSQELLQSALGNLTDPTPAVRISAGDALARLGDIAAVPYLNDAAARDPDEMVRTQLESAMQRLQLKK
jgi:HEAT repeat protein